MLTLPPSTRVFVATKPTDMRRSFNGLLGLVRDFLGEDPFAGHLFVFRNRSGDRLKILWWDRDGLAIFYKRLEEGAFTFPRQRRRAPDGDVGDRLATGAPRHRPDQGEAVEALPAAGGGVTYSQKHFS